MPNADQGSQEVGPRGGPGLAPDPSDPLDAAPAGDVPAWVRALQAQDGVAKYNVDEPRDRRGRWTTGGGSAGAGQVKPAQGSSRPGAPRRHAALHSLGHAAKPIAPNPPASSNQSAQPKPLQLWLEDEFDPLGPVEFSKRAIRFGSWLSTQAHDGTDLDRPAALAEYLFLESRIDFWLQYNHIDEISPRAHGNVLSAALTLYQGAIAAQLVSPIHWPNSMNAVATMAMGMGGSDPLIGMRRLSAGAAEMPEESFPWSPAAAGRIGGSVRNAQVNITWGTGIQDQGEPWEAWLQRQLPGATRLRSNSKTWDLTVDGEARAISAKTIDTTSYTYANRPGRIYSKIAGYVDAAANYGRLRPEGAGNVVGENIQSREIHIATPAFSSPEQQQALARSVLYGRSRGVSVVITRVH